MALTLKTQPATYMPAYNPIEYSFTSTNTAQPNFKYTFKLYIDGVLKDTWRVAPHANNNEGRIDVSRAIAKFIKEDIQPFDTTSMFSYAQETPIQKYRVDAVEYYGTTPLEDDETIITGGDKYAWSGSFEHHDWVNQINEASPFNTWLMNTTNGTSAEFLTTYKSPDVSINDFGWLSCMSDAPTDIDYVEIKTYGASGLIQTCQVTNPLTMTTVPARIVSVFSAPAALNTYSGAFISGAAPIITSSVTYYTIQIFKTGGTAMSEAITFTIKEPCRYTQYRVHFLNELGGFDAYNFQARSQQSSTTTRKSYNRAKDYFDGTGNIVYDHQRNGNQDYYIKNRDKIKLRSDYLTEAEEDWLKELINSPMVFLEFTDAQGNQNFKPIKVVSNNWVDSEKSIDKLFKLELDVELSNENFRQRR